MYIYEIEINQKLNTLKHLDKQLFDCLSTEAIHHFRKKDMRHLFRLNRLLSDILISKRQRYIVKQFLIERNKIKGKSHNETK